MAMSPEAETLDRVRRIETRLTVLSSAMGVTPPGQTPQFSAETSIVQLPSKHTTLHSILREVPRGWDTSVRLMIGDEFIGILDLSRPS